ncbi:hypothetical protein ASF18_12920 [Methylobacterium sp. Leaf89]|nr:hypothetical protein ASF18_12920 [Methylobacterium sp. Leaf89]
MARGSPTRRRLLALLRGLPALGKEAVGAEQPSSKAAFLDPVADPIQRLFAEFQALLDRHEAALAYCDRIEATLLGQMDHPRVPLPPAWDGARRQAADALTILQAVLPGRQQHRLQRVLQRRQRRWDEAAHNAGLTAALVAEAELDGAVLDKADGLLATPARTLDAVVLKLLVLLSIREPEPVTCGLSQSRELRLILMDLRGLADRGRSGS